MKTEKFFELFTELDDELIENALPKEIASKRPAARPVLFRALAIGTAAAAACGALVIGMNAYNKNRTPIIAPASSGIPAHGADDPIAGGFTEGGSITEGVYGGDTMTYPIESGQPAQNPNEFQSIGASMNTNATSSSPYAIISGVWKVYTSPKELVEKVEVIAAGKVTDISFASDKGSLCTIYTVDVATPYKGCSDGTLKFVMYNGLRSYKVEEQLKLLPEDAQFIPVYENEPEINIGEEYLFVLRRFNDSMPTIICPQQTAFPLHDDSFKDEFANASASDIIAYLNG